MATSPEQQAVIDAVGALFDMLQADIEAQHKELQEALPEVAQQANVLQNVLRTALTAALNKCAPFSTELLGEMAVRLASYMISAAPLPMQEDLMVRVLGALPEAHGRRLKAGIMLRGLWEIG